MDVTRDALPRSGRPADADLARYAAALESAVGRIATTTQLLHAVGDPSRTLANASMDLEAFGHTVIAWIWLEQACAAHGKPGAFYDGKRQAARYFFHWELPRINPQLDLLASLDETTLKMRDEWF